MAPPRKIDWDEARRVAESGMWLSRAAIKLKVHHTTLMYIARKKGFRWPMSPKHVKMLEPKETKLQLPRAMRPKPPRREISLPQCVRDPRIERLMELARKVRA